MSQAELEFEEVAPDPSSMIESMRAYGYTLPTAIADLIDNSIAAGAANVWLRFEWNGRDSWVSVSDDGSGMSEDELRRAMRLGSRSPLEARDETDLGRFGLGLKTASLSQCRRLTVVSKNGPGGPALRRWDLDHLAREDVGGWQLLTSPHDGSRGRLELPGKLESGTVVLWELLDRVVEEAEIDDSTIHSHFLKLIEDVDQHLAMVFHRFLSRNRNRLGIFVNGSQVEAWDPFLETHDATDRSPEETIFLGDHEKPVRIKGFVLPHKDRLGDTDHRAASGPGGWNAQQGFYVYRNDRLILPGSWLGLGKSRPWVKEEHFKLARIRVDIPNSMDHLWQLDVKKSIAHPPAQVRGRLTALARAERQKARWVYAHRGRYGQRRAKKELHRAWKSSASGGLLRYRIDRKHPLIEAVLKSVSGEPRSLVQAMLRVIEETVPVQQIWLDVAEKPDAHARPLQGVASKEILNLIKVCYRAFREIKGLDHESAIAALMEMEEFADEEARAVIGVLQEKEETK